MMMMVVIVTMMIPRSITTEEATSCHSPALLSQLASTQQLDTEQLQQLAASWDCVYLHNNIWPAAERAAGGVIDLVSGEAVESSLICSCLCCPHSSVCTSRCGRW